MLKMTNRIKVIYLVCRHTYLAREDRMIRKVNLHNIIPVQYVKEYEG